VCADFLVRELPPRARLLDFGCGSGSIAAGLDSRAEGGVVAVPPQVVPPHAAARFAQEPFVPVGALGGRREPGGKASHKAHLWGMYVAPAFRRRGVGAALLRAAIAHARTRPGVAWLEVSVTTAAPEARRLYEAAGFQVWGEEPDALRHAGQSVAALHMGLRLDPMDTP